MKIKNLLIASVIITLITPQITFASWWNPISWFDNWSFLVKKETVVETPREKVVGLESKINSIATTTATSSTTKNITETTTNATKTPIIKKEEVEKPPIKIDNSTLIKEQVRIQVEATLKAKAEQDALMAKQKADEQIRADLIKAEADRQVKIQADAENARIQLQKEAETRARVEAENSQYCNGKAYSKCPAGQNFSCSGNGGLCLLPPSAYQPPAVIQPIQPVINIQLPTPAQQRQACQKQHDTDVSSLTDRTQQRKNSLERTIAIAQQESINLANNGLTFSGQRVRLGQEIKDAQVMIDNLLISYQKDLEDTEDILQTCLDSVI